MIEQQPHEIVWTLTNAVVPSKCLHLVAELGVADEVWDEPVSVAESLLIAPVSSLREVDGDLDVLALGVARPLERGQLPR